jgi:DNA-directed RNA polymerase specialized sigma24 family protein
MDALEREWDVVCRSRRSTRQMQALRETALEQFPNPAALVQFCNDPSHPIESDEVLAALARHVVTDTFAARALLQAVLPGLKAICGAYQHLGSGDDVASLVVAVAAERIRTYPFERRPERIAANVLADTRQQLWKQSRTAELPAEFQSRAADSVPSVMDELRDVVQEALDAGVINRIGARTIVQSRIFGYTLAEIAVMDNATPATVRQRRHRAERSLEAFVG